MLRPLQQFSSSSLFNVLYFLLASKHAIRQAPNNATSASISDSSSSQSLAPAPGAIGYVKVPVKLAICTRLLVIALFGFIWALNNSTMFSSCCSLFLTVMLRSACLFPFLVKANHLRASQQLQLEFTHFSSTPIE